MSELLSPNSKFNLLKRAENDNLALTPKYVRKNHMIPKTPKTPMTVGRFSLSRRANLAGLKQNPDTFEDITQYQNVGELNS